MSASQGLERTVFSVSEIKPEDRFACWKESISCIFSVDAPKLIRSNEFHAELEAYLLDGVFLCRTQTKQQSWRRGAAEISRDGMDHLMVQIFVNGTMSYASLDDHHILPKAGIVVFDLSRESQSVTNAFENISLVIPRKMIEPLLNDIDDQHLRYFAPDQPLTQMLHAHISNLFERAPFLTPREARLVTPPTLHFVAACLNSQQDETRPQWQRSSTDLAKFFVAKRTILKHISNPNLNVESITKEIGINRSKLYDLFQDHGGVANFIREQRLKHVANLLRSNQRADDKISSLAYASGFRNISSFNRQFRSQYGLSPKDFRQAINSGNTLHIAGKDLKTSLYGKWLHDL